MVAFASDPKAEKGDTQGTEASGIDPSRQARADFSRQFGIIYERSVAADPASTDRLQLRAEQLRVKLDPTLKGEEADQAKVQALLTEVQSLAKATDSYLSGKRNPWGIVVGKAQPADAHRFHDVVTMRVPANHAIRIEQIGGQSICPVTLCQQKYEDRDIGPSKVWRLRDPSDPNFDIVTIGTKRDRQVRVGCVTTTQPAFAGQIRVTDLCNCQSFAVHVNDGKDNSFLAGKRDSLTIDVKAEALIKKSKEPELPRPEPEERFDISYTDNYQAAGFSTFDEYRAATERRNQLPLNYWVAHEGSGLKFKLNHGETLTLAQNGTVVSKFAPSAHGTDIHDSAGVVLPDGHARITRDPDDPQGRTYYLEPGGKHNSKQYEATITKGMGGPEVVSKSAIYLGEEHGKDGGKQPESQVIKSVVNLPPHGFRVTSTEGALVTLDRTQLDNLKIYRDGEVIGEVLSSTKEDVIHIGTRRELVVRRERQSESESTTFRIYAGEPAIPGKYDLWVKSVSGKVVGRSSINVVPDASKPKDTPKFEPTPPSSKESSPGMGSSDGFYVSKQEKKSVTPTVITVAKGETVSLDYAATDTSGRILWKLSQPNEFRGDTRFASIPGVGKVERKILPDGNEMVTITPDGNLEGSLPRALRPNAT